MRSNVRVLQVSHIKDPFSVNGWGAIEKLSREYHHALSQYFHIKTVPSSIGVIEIIKKFAPNYILIHDEALAVALVKSGVVEDIKLVVICHYAYLKEVFHAKKYNVLDYQNGFIYHIKNLLNIFRVRNRLKFLLNSKKVKFIALDPVIVNCARQGWPVYYGKNYIDDPNIGVSLLGNSKLVCVGNIEPRKRQWQLQKLSCDIDFVGPVNDHRFDITKNYLGELDNAQILPLVKEYDALILMSEADLMPLVVIEALMVGVPVFLSSSFYKPFEGVYGVVPLESISDVEGIDAMDFDRARISQESKSIFSLAEKNNISCLIDMITG